MERPEYCTEEHLIALDDYYSEGIEITDMADELRDEFPLLYEGEAKNIVSYWESFRGKY